MASGHSASAEEGGEDAATLPATAADVAALAAVMKGTSDGLLQLSTVVLQQAGRLDTLTITQSALLDEFKK